jgi:tripartite-type tricarboxylate transporter receptor subunit TctC
MRTFKSLCLCFLGFLILQAPFVKAQNYPTKSVRFVVPFSPGGGTDLIARTLAQHLSETFGQTFVVDNHAGAGGVIGADIVAKAPADGYTLLMATPGAMTINMVLMPKMPYQTLRDFAPVSLSTVSPFILTIHPSLPVRDLKAFIAFAKQRPGQLNYGSAGKGSVAHLSTEYLKYMAHIDLEHIPYKGSSLVMTDMLAGQLQVMFDNLPVVLPQIKAGKLRLIGVGTLKRSTLIPEAPTIAESGLSGFESITAFGVVAPARTPEAIVNRLSQQVGKILQNPEVKQKLATQGFEAVGSSADQYRDFLRDEIEKYTRIVKVAKIKIE